MNRFFASFLLFSLFSLGCLAQSADKAFVPLTFPSQDGLIISADLYEVDKTKPYILLCHQASYSRGEYRETALRLNEMGFNCMAIDQRSGSGVNGVKNETAERAKGKGLKTKYDNAEQDIAAAIDYLFEKSGKPIILVGSSYSAALTCKMVKGNDKVFAAAAFSPGEYIKGSNIHDAVAGNTKPLFVTSSKSESDGVGKLVSGVTGDNLTHFTPEKAGKHGSKALWKKTGNHKEYWKAFSAFLDSLK